MQETCTEGKKLLQQCSQLPPSAPELASRRNAPATSAQSAPAKEHGSTRTTPECHLTQTPVTAQTSADKGVPLCGMFDVGKENDAVDMMTTTVDFDVNVSGSPAFRQFYQPGCCSLQE